MAEDPYAVEMEKLSPSNIAAAVGSFFEGGPSSKTSGDPYTQAMSEVGLSQIRPSPDTAAQINADLTRSHQRMAPMFDWSNVTMESIIQNARSIMPQVLLNWADNIMPGVANAAGKTATAPIAPPDPSRVPQLTVESQTLEAKATAEATAAPRSAEAINTKISTTPRPGEKGYNSLDTAYLDIVGADRVAIQRVPAGSEVIGTSANVQQHVDPKTGEIILSVPRVPVQQNQAMRQNDAKVATQVVNDATVRKTELMDINRELARIQQLSGDEHTVAMSQLLSKIEVQMSKALVRIRDQAAADGGYKTAQSALQRNLQLDVDTGFYGRFNQASAQTQRAQALSNTALAASKQLEESYIRSDEEVRQLESIKNLITKVEGRTQAAQDKIALLRSTVTAQQLTNYHAAYGKGKSDDEDRYTVATRRDHDPVMKAVTAADPTNIYKLLTDQNVDIRQKAGKILSFYDNAAAGKQPGPDGKFAEDSRSYKIIKPYIDNPLLIIKEAGLSKEQQAELENKYRLASPKEQQELKAIYVSNYLQKIVQDKVVASYNDMRAWKSDSITPGSPIQQTIDKVSTTNPGGAAPLNSVVTAFMETEFKGPDGKLLTSKEKEAMLENTMLGAVNNGDKTMLLTDYDFARLRLSRQIKETSMRYHINELTRQYSEIWGAKDYNTMQGTGLTNPFSSLLGK